MENWTEVSCPAAFCQGREEECETQHTERVSDDINTLPAVPAVPADALFLSLNSLWSFFPLRLAKERACVACPCACV